MTFPRFDFRRSRPWRMLLHPWEQDEADVVSKKPLFLQYFRVSTLASKQSGLVRILHEILANRAWLKILNISES